MPTIEGDLYVTGSVIASENEIASKNVTAFEDIGAARDVTAIRDIAAGRNVVAGNLVTTNGTIGAAGDITSQTDVAARRNVAAVDQPTVYAPTTPTTVDYFTGTTLPTSQPGLRLTSTSGASYVVYIDDGAPASAADAAVPKPVLVLIKLKPGV